MTWADCLTPGLHELKVTVSYDNGLPDGELAVPFDWQARSEVVTWSESIEPIYVRYCARANCHVGGFEPNSYESWVEKIDNIIERTALPLGEPGRMPPSGASPTDTELLLIRWWREDGLLRE